MRITSLAAAALFAQAGLAIPHGLNHGGHHVKRAVSTIYSTLIDTVTVTDENAVVWVDNAGKIVKTEYNAPEKTPPVAPVTPTIGSASSPTVVDTTTTVPAATALHSIEPATSVPTSVAVPVTSPIPVPPTSKIAPQSPSSSPSIPIAVPPVPAAANKAPSKAGNIGAISGFGVAYDAWSGSGCRAGLDAEFAFMASQGASKIRVYDSCFRESVNAAAAHNLKLMIGITSFDDFDNKLSRLITEVTSTQAGWSVVDTVFIGNELVNSGAASSQAVADKVSVSRGVLKTKGYTGSVVTVDTWVRMRDDSVICSTSDYCAVNAHAFFDGNVLPPDAGAFVRRARDAVAARNSGKNVVITESGWPHAGSPQGVSLASVAAQRVAMASIIKEFAADAPNIFLFMGYDATYKINQPEIERNFGLFDQDHFDGTL